MRDYREEQGTSNMYEIPPAEPLATLLQTFERIGGALYYVQIGLDEQDLKGNLAQRHKAAAIFTARIVIDRGMEYLLRIWPTEKARWKKEYPGLTQSTLYRVRHRAGIQIRPEQAKGQPIPLAQFFLLPPPYNRMEEFPSWLNVTAFTPTESVDQSLWLKSYPRAFLDPPYGLLWQRENTRPENLFQAINQEIFNDDINLFTVYQWSTHWIDFLHFQPDPYSVFWGSYLWTVSGPLPTSMFGIAGAATE